MGLGEGMETARVKSTFPTPETTYGVLRNGSYLEVPESQLRRGDIDVTTGQIVTQIYPSMIDPTLGEMGGPEWDTPASNSLAAKQLAAYLKQEMGGGTGGSGSTPRVVYPWEQANVEAETAYKQKQTSLLGMPSSADEWIISSLWNRVQRGEITDAQATQMFLDMQAQQSAIDAQVEQQQMEADWASQRFSAASSMWNQAAQLYAEAMPYALRPGQTYYPGFEPGGPIQNANVMANLPYNAESYKFQPIQYNPWQEAQQVIQQYGQTPQFGPISASPVQAPQGQAPAQGQLSPQQVSAWQQAIIAARGGQ